MSSPASALPIAQEEPTERIETPVPRLGWRSVFTFLTETAVILGVLHAIYTYGRTAEKLETIERQVAQVVGVMATTHDNVLKLCEANRTVSCK